MKQCRICKSETILRFNKRILNKYEVGYYQCQNCNFIQPEKLFWMKEAYEQAIHALDVGIVERNLTLAGISSGFIRAFYKKEIKALDYGGGTGLFVRMMRDKGFDFYWKDKYCENLFARFFEVQNDKTEPSFDLITAFEVFEHFSDPVKEIEEMLMYGETILFSTEFIPKTKIEDWWYLVPEGGQHISLYSESSLKLLAKKLGCYFQTNGLNIHLFTRDKNLIKTSKFAQVTGASNGLISRLINKLSIGSKAGSLIASDYQFVKSMISR